MDISLCSNGSKCDKKGCCRRWLLIGKTDERWQCYSEFYEEGKECKHFWDWNSN